MLNEHYSVQLATYHCKLTAVLPEDLGVRKIITPCGVMGGRSLIWHIWIRLLYMGGVTWTSDIPIREAVEATMWCLPKTEDA